MRKTYRLTKRISISIRRQRGDNMVQYFIKNTRVHKYPVPSNCHVKYEGETLHDTIPEGYDKCDHCFGLPP